MENPSSRTATNEFDYYQSFSRSKEIRRRGWMEKLPAEKLTTAKPTATAQLWKTNSKTKIRLIEKESRTKAILWKANLRTKRRVFKKKSGTKAILWKKI